jgi:hypothetical protein
MEPESSLLCSQEPSTDPYLSHTNPVHTISFNLSILGGSLITKAWGVLKLRMQETAVRHEG